MVSRKDLRPYSKVQGAKVFSPVGVWKNELGATMKVKDFDGINFAGTYTSLVSADNKTVTGELAGTLTGDAIAFTVNWKEEFSSVTAWCGLVLGDDGALAIYALWHLASTPEEATAAWQSINAGADLFLSVE